MSGIKSLFGMLGNDLITCRGLSASDITDREAPIIEAMMIEARMALDGEGRKIMLLLPPAVALSILRNVLKHK